MAIGLGAGEPQETPNPWRMEQAGFSPVVPMCWHLLGVSPGVEAWGPCAVGLARGCCMSPLLPAPRAGAGTGPRW